MPIVRMVQMTVHKIVDVVAVRNRLMPTIRSVNMCCIMALADMTTRAFGWVRVVYVQSVLLDDSILGLMVQMTIVQKIDMVSVLDGGMPAIGSVYMRVVVVCMAHSLCFSLFKNW
jgi:hypothetical protein